MNGLPQNHPILLQQLAAIQASKRATELMDEYGLTEQGWVFRISKTKTFLGMCYYHKKIIEFSENFLHEPWEEIEDTILHEIAHALAFNRYGEDGKGHGDLWKMVCREVGADPTATTHGVKSAAKHNYVIKCSKCGKVTGRKYRLKKALIQRYVSKCCSAKLQAYRIVRG